MNENEFMQRQAEAVERMREMNSRATVGSTRQPMPPVPPFVRLQGNRQGNRGNNGQTEARRQPERISNEIPLQKLQISHQKTNKSNNFLDGLNIPFLDKLKGETDIALIIGLILILMSEKADKRLLFALVYILM